MSKDQISRVNVVVSPSHLFAASLAISAAFSARGKAASRCRFGMRVCSQPLVNRIDMPSRWVLTHALRLVRVVVSIFGKLSLLSLHLLFQPHHLLQCLRPQFLSRTRILKIGWGAHHDQSGCFNAASFDVAFAESQTDKLTDSSLPTLLFSACCCKVADSFVSSFSCDSSVLT